MKDQTSSKDKAKDALPLKTGAFPLKKDATDEPKKPEELTSKSTIEGARSNYGDIEDVIGTRRERRECAVGVRVTREMKEVLEGLAAKTRLSESEIVFRILRKNLKMDMEA